MNSQDFIHFKTANKNFFRWEHVVELSKKTVTLSDKFQQVFPQLTRLLSLANARNIVIDHELHTLYTWENTNAKPCGWLCKNEEFPLDFPLIPSHQMLLSEMGGIRESYGSNEKDLGLCQNFFFIGSCCEIGLGNRTKFYEELCQAQGYQPLKTGGMVTFVLEASGNRTLYDIKSEKVLLYASDHNYDYVTPVPHQPEYTFYTIHGVDTFTDYVELLARQWLEFVKMDRHSQ